MLYLSIDIHLQRGETVKINFNNFEPNEVIRFIREATGLTQKEFGKSIGKKERTIQDYESGRRRYYTTTLKQICKVHKINIIITDNKEEK